MRYLRNNSPSLPRKNTILIYCHPSKYDGAHIFRDLIRKIADKYSIDEIKTLDITTFGNTSPDILADGFSPEFIENYKGQFKVVFIPDCSGKWLTYQDKTKYAPRYEKFFELIENLKRLLTPDGVLFFSKIGSGPENILVNDKRYTRLFYDWIGSYIFSTDTNMTRKDKREFYDVYPEGRGTREEQFEEKSILVAVKEPKDILDIFNRAVLHYDVKTLLFLFNLDDIFLHAYEQEVNFPNSSDITFFNLNQFGYRPSQDILNIVNEMNNPAILQKLQEYNLVPEQKVYSFSPSVPSVSPLLQRVPSIEQLESDRIPYSAWTGGGIFALAAAVSAIVTAVVLSKK